MNDKLTKKGIVKVEQYRNGKMIKSFTFHNIITNLGKAESSKLYGLGLSGTAFSYIALGTGTTAVAATDTTLEGEITDTGLQRASATVALATTTTTNDTTRFTKTFTATGVKAVAKIGIFNASSAGVLACEQLFPGVITTANLDTIAITYDIVNA